MANDVFFFSKHDDHFMEFQRPENVNKLFLFMFPYFIAQE